MESAAVATTTAALESEPAVVETAAADTAKIIHFPDQPLGNVVPAALAALTGRSPAEKDAIANALLTALEAAADAPVTVQHLDILHHLYKMRLQGDRAADIFKAKLDTLRADANTAILTCLDGVVYERIACGSGQSGALPHHVLTTLERILAENPCAAHVWLNYRAAPEPYLVVLKHCHDTLVTRNQPLDSLLLQMVRRCLTTACSLSRNCDTAMIVSIVDKCGLSAQQLGPQLFQYGCMIRSSDVLSALKLTIMPAPDNHGGSIVAFMTDIIIYVKTMPGATEVCLYAVKWVEEKCRQSKSVFPEGFYKGRSVIAAVTDCIIELAGYSEAVARAIVASPAICDFVHTKAVPYRMCLVMKRLVFWWAQIQWQIDNQPATTQMLDMKTKYDVAMNYRTSFLTFKTVVTPDAFPLDIATVLNMVVGAVVPDITATGVAMDKDAALTIVRAVHSVAPRYVLENPAVREFIVKNPEHLPDLFAAVVL